MSTVASVRVWDPLIRIFHWGLVVAFTIAYFTAEEESALHIYSGYTVLGLIVFRVIWGFIGTRHARFSDFVFGPTTLMHYVRNVVAGHPKRYLGHNPLGGLMILAMLIVLAVVTYSGLVVYAIEENAGPLATMVEGPTVMPIAAARAEGDEEQDDHEGGAQGDEAREEFWEEIHEAAANIMLVLITLHLAGVALGSFSHRENLVKAMITGYKPRKED